jgi:opacity protein-like surface antigen
LKDKKNMKKISKIISLASTAVILLASVSHADTLLGARVSYGHFKADGSNQVAGGSNTTGSQTANFPYASIFVEHGVANGFSVGLDYVPFSAEIDARSKSDTDLQSGTTTATGTKKASANLKHHTTLYINTPSKNNFYAKVGYSAAQVDIEDFAVLSGQAAIATKRDTMHGPMIGAGYQKELSNGLILKAEVTYTNYNEVRFSGASGSTVKADTENLAGHIGIAKKF